MMRPRTRRSKETKVTPNDVCEELRAALLCFYDNLANKLRVCCFILETIVAVAALLFADQYLS
jgi:hypothetical protein